MIMKVEKRGRPRKSENVSNYADDTSIPKSVEIDADGFFRRKLYREDGTMSSIWTFNPKKSMVNPISVQQCEEDGSLSLDAEPSAKELKKLAKLNGSKPKSQDPVDNENLPKSARKYLAPNGKMVGYTRARMLNLVK